MSREAKILLVDPYHAQSRIDHNEAFGWEAIGISGQNILVSRETQNPVYPQLVAYEQEYEEKSAALSHLSKPVPPPAPKPINIVVAIVAFLLFIIPGVLYVLYTLFQKKKREEAMARYTAEMEAYETENHALLNEMRRILAESRALFFSPRE